MTGLLEFADAYIIVIVTSTQELGRGINTGMAGKLQQTSRESLLYKQGRSFSASRSSTLECRKRDGMESSRIPVQYNIFGSRILDHRETFGKDFAKKEKPKIRLTRFETRKSSRLYIRQNRQRVIRYENGLFGYPESGKLRDKQNKNSLITKTKFVPRS